MLVMSVGPGKTLVNTIRAFLSYTKKHVSLTDLNLMC